MSKEKTFLTIPTTSEQWHTCLPSFVRLQRSNLLLQASLVVPSYACLYSSVPRARFVDGRRRRDWSPSSTQPLGRFVKIVSRCPQGRRSLGRSRCSAGCHDDGYAAVAAMHWSHTSLVVRCLDPFNNPQEIVPIELCSTIHEDTRNSSIENPPDGDAVVFFKLNKQESNWICQSE